MTPFRVGRIVLRQGLGLRGSLLAQSDRHEDERAHLQKLALPVFENGLDEVAGAQVPQIPEGRGAVRALILVEGVPAGEALADQREQNSAKSATERPFSLRTGASITPLRSRAVVARDLDELVVQTEDQKRRGPLSNEELMCLVFCSPRAEGRGKRASTLPRPRANVRGELGRLLFDRARQRPSVCSRASVFRPVVLIWDSMVGCLRDRLLVAMIRGRLSAHPDLLQSTCPPEPADKSRPARRPGGLLQAEGTRRNSGRSPRSLGHHCRASSASTSPTEIPSAV